MPFQIVSNGKPGGAPLLDQLRLDTKLESRLAALRHDSYTRWHPQGARISGDPFAAIDGHLVDPSHVIDKIRLRKAPTKPLPDWGSVEFYSLMSDRVYNQVARFSPPGMQFFPVHLVHDEVAFGYWIFRFTRLMNSIDYAKSGYTERRNDSGGTYWSAPAQRQMLYLRRDRIPSDLAMWREVPAGVGMILSDELGPLIEPWLERGTMLAAVAWS